MRSDHARAVVAHYDERAASYDESTMHRLLAASVADWLIIDGAEVVLDVATGTGLMLRSLAERPPDLRLVGVDLSPSMLAVACDALPGAAFVLGDAAALPVADGSVDLLTCITALHLFDQPGHVLAEWGRVVRSGGRVVTATFRPAEKHIRGPHRGGFVRRHDSYRSPELIAGAFAPHGFTLERHADWEDGEDRLLVCEMSAR